MAPASLHGDFLRSRVTPCLFPLPRTIPRTPLPCHCRLGSAPSYDVPCSFPLPRAIPRKPLGATAVSAVLFLTTYLARVPLPRNHSANTSWCHCRLGSALSYDVPCSFPSRRSVPRTPLGATAVSAVLLLTTYLVRSLFAEPFREHLSAAAALRILACLHSASPEGTYLNQPGWSRCERCEQRAPRVRIHRIPASPTGWPWTLLASNHPVRASRSAISDTLCPRARNRNRLCSSLCSLRFLLFIRIFVFVLASIDTQFRRGEPRNTRNTRKVGKDNDPGLPVGRLWFPPVVLPPPAQFSPKAISTLWSSPAPWQRPHPPRISRFGSPPAGGERTHSLALRACTRWRVPPTSTQREQVDPTFRSWLCRGEAALECGNLLPLSGMQPHANTPRSRVPDLPTPICDLRHIVSSVLEIVIVCISLCFLCFLLFISHLRLRVGVNRDSTQTTRTTKDTNHTEKQSGYQTEARRGNGGIVAFVAQQEQHAFHFR